MFLKKLPTGTDTYHQQQETLLVLRLHSDALHFQEVPPVFSSMSRVLKPKTTRWHHATGFLASQTNGATEITS